MQETLESSRRWSGFVCPDCRFVFRVPRDHDGRGVVCPSCRRLLKIPLADDHPPPLQISLELLAEENALGGALPALQSRRRRQKKQRAPGEHAWDSDTGLRRSSRRGDKGQKFWMLMGGALLLTLLVAGALMAMWRGGASNPRLADPVAGPAHPAAAPAGVKEWSETAVLAATEPLARRFLEARRIEELLPLVRNPEVAAARMRRHYPEGKIEPPGLAEFNIDSGVSHHGDISSIPVRIRDFASKSLDFVETPQGLKIDWESWVGWSDMSWQEFMTTKPASGQVFRVYLSEVDYYNFAFADDLKWQAYRLSSPDDGQSLYGYAERGSDVNAKLRPPPESKQMAVTLVLKYPATAPAPNQVLIEKFVTDGWVLTPAQSP